MPSNFKYPWYTHCTNYLNWTPWSIPYVKLIIAGAGLLVGPFLVPVSLVAVAVGAVCGFWAVNSVFDYLLGGKLVCLGGGADQIVCGTVTHLEPPQDSIFSPGNIDNDYSWNMLLCPYQLIQRMDSNGNPVMDSSGNPLFDPEPYGPPGTGMQDYLCLETIEFTTLYNKYPATTVAPNPYAQTAQLPGQQNNANIYFTALNNSPSPAALPAGFSLPPGFPPPGITLPTAFPTNPGYTPDIPLPVFGQSDTPSGTVLGDSGFEFTTQTTGLSAQMHCEIEGSRINNIQTAANVIMAILTVAAVAAAIVATTGPLGWLLALLILIIAIIVGVIIYLATWKLGSDPNVTGGPGTSTTPNEGFEGVENELTLNVGDFIVVLGRWVFDMGHSPSAGSNELHPVKQVYVPTSKSESADFCDDFCIQYSAVIRSSLTPATSNNQSLSEYSYILHPDVDGCGPANDSPPVLNRR